jgi:hypothetical protein
LGTRGHHINKPADGPLTPAFRLARQGPTASAFPRQLPHFLTAIHNWRLIRLPHRLFLAYSLLRPVRLVTRFARFAVRYLLSR